MARRLELHAILKTITTNVYFQPPTNVEIKYPAIVYHRDGLDTVFANNSSYRHVWRYTVIAIDRNPDSGLPDKIAELPKCTFRRSYTADNLNHDAFQLYF